MTSRLLVASILRIVEGDPHFFEGPTRARSVQFLEATVPELFRYLRVSSTDQSHEKLAAIGQAAHQLRSELQGEVASLATGANLKRSQEGLFKRLRGPLGKHLVAPLLDEQLVGERLTTVFDLTRDAIDASHGDFFDAYERALPALDSFKRDAARVGTLDAVGLLANIAEALEERLAAAREQNPLAQPATVHVSLADRRYPLAETGVQMEILLEVTNNGPGMAQDVCISIDDSEGLQLEDHELHLGALNVERILAPIKVRGDGSGTAVVIGAVRWLQMAGEAHQAEFCEEVLPQRAGADWEALSQESPYALEAVTDESQLAGREDQLRELIAQLQRATMENVYITGQKRVGKTSIAQTARRRIDDRDGAFFKTRYFEAGNFGSPEAETTVRSLTKRIFSFVKKADNRLAALSEMDPEEGFGALVDVFEEVHEIAPELRFIIVIDEFDELPVDLYQRGSPVGDAFFLSLRSVSGLPFVSFILIGGEKLPMIMSYQGQQLNRFDRHQVDYFDRAEEWPAFVDLVERPVQGQLEYDAHALEDLYGLTAGSPYFTKIVCKDVLAQAIERRDAVVGRREVERATRRALRSLDQSKFAHFWEDGILEAPLKHEAVSLLRRQVLFALGGLSASGKPISREALFQAMVRFDAKQSEVDAEVTSFVSRGILEEEPNGIRARVGLFGRWLREYGRRELVLSVSDPEAWDEDVARREKARVRPDEIEDVIASWRMYRGREIRVGDVQEWMAQFGDVFEERLAFDLLRGLRFYGADLLRGAMKTLYAEIFGGPMPDAKELNTTLVSYLDGGTKSGASMARKFASTNAMNWNASDRASLGELVGERGARRVVFVDDLIGSGNNVTRGLTAALEDFPALAESEIEVVVAVVAATQVGLASVERSKSVRALGAKIFVADVLGDEDVVLGEGSKFFPDGEARESARRLFTKFGEELQNRQPLGYRDGGLAVVFEDSTPNNSLPILWKAKRNWKPLFPR